MTKFGKEEKIKKKKHKMVQDKIKSIKNNTTTNKQKFAEKFKKELEEEKKTIKDIATIDGIKTVLVLKKQMDESMDIVAPKDIKDHINTIAKEEHDLIKQSRIPISLQKIKEFVSTEYNDRHKTFKTNLKIINNRYKYRQEIDDMRKKIDKLRCKYYEEMINIIINKWDYKKFGSPQDLFMFNDIGHYSKQKIIKDVEDKLISKFKCREIRIK